MEPGINRENIKEVMEKLKDAIGENWVSDDPAVLTAYSRDFTITPGNWPHIVVLPESTEDVSKIIKIAIEHKIPVVPMSSGFNHGGMAVPRKGGIQVDLLKRMDKIVDLDGETMTITVQPGVRTAIASVAAQRTTAVDDKRKLVAAIPLAMGSVSILSNYVARGGAGTMLKHGNTPDAILGMTWVLPDGEILKTGPVAVPEVGPLPLAFGPGPDIGGMFLNASGSFGICTEMTIKLFPEPVKESLFVLDLDDRENNAWENIIDFFYEVPRLDFSEMLYKSHGGSMATQTPDPEVCVEDVSESMAEHITVAEVAGDTDEEIEIKTEKMVEIAEQCGMYNVMIELFADAFGGVDNIGLKRHHRAKLGLQMGRVMGAGKGSFQWIACNPKQDAIPKIAREYDQLLDKYWVPTDPDCSRLRAMAGIAMQGPYQFGRVGTLEYDYWWDPGNTEIVKRATRMLQKSAELDLKHGCPMWRNMYDTGEIHLPRLGTYYDLLKDTKREFDPDNLMHPDVDPLTEDYI